MARRYIDIKSTRNSYTFFGFELLIISIILGMYYTSWWIFGAAFILSVVLLNIPIIAKIIALMLSCFWGMVGYQIGLNFSHNAAIVLAIIAFLISLGVHTSAMTYFRDVDA